MTGWTIPYVLDETTLSQLMMIYRYVLDFEETKSIILLNQYAMALSGKSNKKISDKPDLKRFNILYGSKIKTPKKKE